MQFSKLEIHILEENIVSILSPPTLHPKDCNLHTHHHKNLTLSRNKFEPTTKAATGAAAKAAVNKFATG
jgi:hypothetical protein